MTSVQAKYDFIGNGYIAGRQPDPRIAKALRDALGDAKSLINVGAGTGSYEPKDMDVMAVEPSQVMIDQRLKTAAPVTKGSAESIPFAENSFDAAMGVLTLHHWSNWQQGIAELKRVAKKRIVILTFDPEFVDKFWLIRDYLPEGATLDRDQFPPINDIVAALGGATIAALPIPEDCVDGFLCAYWKRPEAYLDPAVRACISTFAQVGKTATNNAIKKLEADLTSGQWLERYGELLQHDAIDFGYRIIVADM